ncbi:hypothetical protein [Candidatus Thiosymbion oneisti]|uniref:hypothetical protein n=1 Tax=Candidatus Thiosymbion oneisti TaxID=589554 RepID=UPI001061BA34|nr:hypothetical protein [Candidatus Thiosymbion oneisti]
MSVLKKIFQVIKDPFLGFLLILVLSILGVIWLFLKYGEKLPLPYTYITFIVAVGVAAVLGAWVHLAGVRQERDSLLEERERDNLLAVVQRERDELLKARKKLAKNLRNARDDYQRCQELLDKHRA